MNLFSLTISLSQKSAVCLPHSSEPPKDLEQSQYFPWKNTESCFKIGISCDLTDFSFGEKTTLRVPEISFPVSISKDNILVRPNKCQTMLRYPPGATWEHWERRVFHSKSSKFLHEPRSTGNIKDFWCECTSLWAVQEAFIRSFELKLIHWDQRDVLKVSDNYLELSGVGWRHLRRGFSREIVEISTCASDGG